jgi:hypothetical protein
MLSMAEKAIKMAIYARTEEGQWAAYNPESALPRKLKSLLKAIDGKTNDDVYTRSLSAFGDVHLLLESLLQANLIRAVPAAASQFKVLRDRATTDRDLLLRPRSSSDDWSETRAATTVIPSTWEPSVMPSRNADAWGFGETSVQTAFQLQGGGAGYKQALELMANFVLTHMPRESFEILKELEAITSVEQLAVVLGGYEQLIVSTGELGRQHLGEVKQILRNSY